MCGIAGFVCLQHKSAAAHPNALDVMGKLISHRGPDGEGVWKHENSEVGFAHRRLSIIDLSSAAKQPMLLYLSQTRKSFLDCMNKSGLKQSHSYAGCLHSHYGMSATIG